MMMGGVECRGKLMAEEGVVITAQVKSLPGDRGGFWGMPGLTEEQAHFPMRAGKVDHT